MADYIDRNKIKYEIVENVNSTGRTKHMVERNKIEAMPSVDAVEITRCEIEKFVKWLNGKFEFNEGCFFDCEYGEIWQIKEVINKYERECKDEIN